ncbi:subtilisin-like serine protease [Pyrrhoderma noxium]|uniref:Subtilisin-like serine protease n=1 Tax=Pyrrhoderma noxium TaxID=2282107 RepID=A0A286UT14_9AGAM|nr:subtilisin-like serine protease [Pyrrhoderma noxium]
MADIYSESEGKRLELLSRVKRQLWFAGMHRGKIRPLHRQVVLGRDIVISEDISLHLVTRGGKTIFIKPFPGRLLKLENEGADTETVVVTERTRNDNILLGFISSYLSMIQSETDLRIALDNYLLPSILLPRDLRNKRIESKEELEKAFQEWTRIKETWEIAITRAYRTNHPVGLILSKNLFRNQGPLQQHAYIP